MEIRKLFIYFMLIMGMISLSNAALSNSTIYYWDLDSLNGDVGSVDFNLYNTPTSVAGINGNGYQVTGTGTSGAGGNQLYTDNLDKTQLDYQDDYCVSYWANYGTKKIGGYTMWAIGGTGINAVSEYTGTSAANNIWYVGNQWSSNTGEFAGTNDASFHHYLVCQDATNGRVYAWEDNVLKLNESKTFVSNTNDRFLNLGATAAHTYGSTGNHIFDEVAIFNKVLDADERSTLSSGCFYGDECYGTLDLINSNEAYWSLDNVLTDSTGNGNTLTPSGASYTSSGKINGGYDFESGDLTDELYTSSNNLALSDSFSYNVWFKRESTGTVMHLIERRASTGGNALNTYLQIKADNTLLTGFRDSGDSTWYSAGTTETITDTNWHMATVVFNSGDDTLKIYIDKVERASTSSITLNPYSEGTQDFVIGNNWNLLSPFDGVIDEVSVWKRALNTSEIDNLYNSDNGLQHPYGVAPLPIISIDDISLINGSYFNDDFNISLNISQTDSNNNINTSYFITETFIDPTYAGESIWYSSITPFYTDTTFVTATQFCIEEGYNTYVTSTTSSSSGTGKYYTGAVWSDIIQGTKIYDSVTCANSVQFGTNTLQPNATINISELSEGEHLIYFIAENNETSDTSNNITFIIDLTNPIVNLIGNISENVFEVNFSDIFNVTELNPDTCIINITELENVTTPDNFLIDCTDTESFDTAGLHNAFVTATDLAGNIGTYDYNFTIQPIVYIGFNDTNTNTSITNYSVRIFHPDGRVTSQTDTLGFIELSPVNNGVLDLGIHTIEFNKIGYVLGNATINITEGSASQNISFNIPGAKIQFVIYDIDDYSIVNDSTTTIEIIGDSFSNIYETTTGYYNVSSLIMAEETYNVIVSNSNFETSTYSFNYNNQELIEVPIYLTPTEVNDTLIADLIINVVNDYQRPIRDVTINVIQYVWDSGQSRYVQTNLKATDYNGQTSFKVFLNTKLYNFCADYLGTLYCEEDLSININTQSVTIEIPISEIALPDEDTIYDIDFSASLQSTDLGNNYSSVTFTWNNPNQDVDEYCLKIYSIANLKRTLQANQCETSHSNAVSVNVLNNNSINYYAVATIEVDGNIRDYDELYLYGRADLEDELISFGLVKIILIVLVSLVIGVALHKKVHNVLIAHLGLPIIFFIASIVFSSYISAESFVLVLITNLFAWKIVTKKDDVSKPSNYTTLTSILMLYMVFIFGLFVVLTEMNTKGLLDDYGTNLLNNIDDENSYFSTYIDTASDDLKSKRADANVGAWELLTAIFLKTLEFVDLFFSILANLFNIVSNMVLILGIKNSLLLQIAKVLDFGVVGTVIYLYFKEAFK